MAVCLSDGQQAGRRACTGHMTIPLKLLLAGSAAEAGLNCEPPAARARGCTVCKSTGRVRSGTGNGNGFELSLSPHGVEVEGHDELEFCGGALSGLGAFMYGARGGGSVAELNCSCCRI